MKEKGKWWSLLCNKSPCQIIDFLSTRCLYIDIWHLFLGKYGIYRRHRCSNRYETNPYVFLTFWSIQVGITREYIHLNLCTDNIREFIPASCHKNKSYSTGPKPTLSRAISLAFKLSLLFFHESTPAKSTTFVNQI